MAVNTDLARRLGIEYRIVGFTPSEKVAAAITRAGGMGVLGCVRFNDPEELDRTLDWMDANTDGKPYGVDIVMPATVPQEGTAVDLDALIPAEHRAFVDRTLTELGVPPLSHDAAEVGGVLGWLHSVAKSHAEVAFRHPIKLIANALGSPPADVVDAAHDHGVPVAALAGKPEHATRHVDKGIDIVIAQGYEAGGHTGEIASMVLIPEIVDALDGRAAVLGAGGIGSGRQIAAALALGAQGVWMGSYWLTTSEYDLGIRPDGISAFQSAMLEATSSDTVRRKIYSGKPARLLRTKWTDAWDQPGAPSPLPMPLQNLLVGQAHRRIDAAMDPGVVSMPVGQIVGRMNSVRPVAEVMADLVSEYEETVNRLEKSR